MTSRDREGRRLLLKAVLAFLILPGTNAFLFPLLLAPDRQSTNPLHWLGLPVLAIGIVILLWCVRDFYVSGKGTLAPWTPPKNLVRVGLYRFSRNPMYVGVSTIVFGWALWYMSRAILVFGILLTIAFHLRVILGEEPWLARTHGETWTAYKSKVPRWFL